MNFLSRLFIFALFGPLFMAMSVQASTGSKAPCEDVLVSNQVPKPIAKLIASVARKLNQPVSVSFQFHTERFWIADFYELQNHIRASSFALLELKNIRSDGKGVTVQVAVSGMGLEVLKALTVVASGGRMSTAKFVTGRR